MGRNVPPHHSKTYPARVPVVVSMLRNCLNMIAQCLYTTVRTTRNQWLGLHWSSLTWGFGYRYVVIFLYVQFWIRLAAVSYRGKKVRTLASPVVRSINKSHGTRNCVQNEPDYAICVIFTTRLYYKALGLILCALIWQIHHNYTVLTMASVMLQVNARCQSLERSVPWWPPMKSP